MSVDCRGGAARRNRPTRSPGCGRRTSGRLQSQPAARAARTRFEPGPSQLPGGCRARPSARVGIEWHPVPLHLAPQRQETAPCGCERLWPPRCCSRPTDPRRHPRPHARPTADRGPGLRHRQQPISGPTACSLRQRCEVPLARKEYPMKKKVTNTTHEREITRRQMVGMLWLLPA